MTLVAHGEGVNYFGNDFGADLFQAFDRLLCNRGIRVRLADQGSDQLIRTKSTENGHQRQAASTARLEFDGKAAFWHGERERMAPGIRLLARDSICALIKNAINFEFD